MDMPEDAKRRPVGLAGHIMDYEGGPRHRRRPHLWVIVVAVLAPTVLKAVLLAFNRGHSLTWLPFVVSESVGLAILWCARLPPISAVAASIGYIAVQTMWLFVFTLGCLFYVYGEWP